MSNIVDRRLNPRDKTIKNRQKFIQRSHAEIKKSVKDAIDSGHIADIENGKVKIKVKGIGEPSFGIDHKTGNKKFVMPGNDRFIVDDTQEKPKDESGGGGKTGGLGRGEDEFEFELNRDEFLQFIFEDLELPDLAKKQMKDVTKVEYKRAGYTNAGNPSQLDVVKSLKNSLGRRIGLGRPTDEELELLEAELLGLGELLEDNPHNLAAINRFAVVTERIAEIKQKRIAIPWMDPFDIRYRNFIPTPQPMTKAVMFCIMDVSGSMGQREKDLAKRFFVFLYMFLERKYEKVEIVFIRHHEVADEVDEETFFNSRESGGTVVSSALQLTKDIIKTRYNINDWNIYAAQVSDGDNYTNDGANSLKLITEILPLVQHYAYVEISSEYNSTPMAGTDLWKTYKEVEDEFSHLNMRKVKEVADIWKVFKDLFKRSVMIK